MKWTNKGICPICGHADEWCGTSEDGGATICMRVASDRPTANGGWLHIADGTNKLVRYDGARVTTIDTSGPRDDIALIAEQYRGAAWAALIEDFASSLGVTPESLIRLGTGWAFDKSVRKGPGAALFDAGDAFRMNNCRVFSFPLTDVAGRVLGIRLRREDAEKWSVSGGREGLFIPADLAGDHLLIAEGPTDCAALLSLGFDAVGRPSCRGGVKLLVAMVQGRRPEAVTIVADADEAGYAGAGLLASTLRAYCPVVKVIAPPVGIKDVRVWKNAGATADDILDAISDAKSWALKITASIEAGVAVEVQYV